MLAFTGLACAKQNPDNSANKPQVINCLEPRPQVCTKEYRPVCAARDTKIRCITVPCPSVEFVSYPNACTACFDSRVYYYRPGACGS